MQLRLFAQVLSGVAFALALVTTTTSNQPSYAESEKFFCTQEKGVPVTKVRTTRGDETFIRWVVTDFKEFPPLQRCEIVTKRFQRYYDNGEIYITSRNNFNSYPVLCITNRKGAPCTSDNILVTLKPGANTGLVLKQMLDFRRGADASPINLSKCKATTYDNQGNLYIDVKQFLDGKKCSASTSSTNANQTEPVEPRF
ncbi:hypothetical protein BLD44_006330 [Mastigocladus laminosus UU774]|nr:hypothetical protein BLD44_006330 [Mastigocladus laminosus UU774]